MNTSIRSHLWALIFNFDFTFKTIFEFCSFLQSPIKKYIKGSNFLFSSENLVKLRVMFQAFKSCIFCPCYFQLHQFLKCAYFYCVQRGATKCFCSKAFKNWRCHQHWHHRIKMHNFILQQPCIGQEWSNENHVQKQLPHLSWNTRLQFVSQVGQILQGKEGSQNFGHCHGNFHHMLATIFCHQHHFRLLYSLFRLKYWGRISNCHLAWMDELRNESMHLCVLFKRL